MKKILKHTGLRVYQSFHKSIKNQKKKGSNFAKLFNIQEIIRTNTCLDKEVSAHRFHVRIVLLTSELNHVNML